MTENHNDFKSPPFVLPPSNDPQCCSTLLKARSSENLGPSCLRGAVQFFPLEVEQLRLIFLPSFKLDCPLQKDGSRKLSRILTPCGLKRCESRDHAFDARCHGSALLRSRVLSDYSSYVRSAHRIFLPVNSVSLVPACFWCESMHLQRAPLSPRRPCGYIAKILLIGAHPA